MAAEKNNKKRFREKINMGKRHRKITLKNGVRGLKMHLLSYKFQKFSKRIR